MSIYFETITISYLLNILLMFAIIFLERKDPSATLSWILVLLIFPGFGFFFYLLLSQNFSRKTIFTMKIKAKRSFGDLLSKQQEKFENDELVFNDANIEEYKDILKMNLYKNQSLFTQDNTVEVLLDGNEKIKSLIEAIEAATDSIHVLYYIVNNDSTGKMLMDALMKKAKEGIEVRFLFDSIGSRKLSKKIVQQLTEAGVKTESFFSSIIPLINFKVNYRNHRKIVVIDGKTGFIGGFNIGDEYRGLNKKFGYWRDTHLKVVGSAAAALQKRFFLDWGNASKEDLNYSARYFPFDDCPECQGNTGIQIISSGPDERDEVIKQNYVKMINSAQHNIIIQTPYFIPDASVLDALKIAALSGVEISIMIPNKPDHMFVYWATYHYAGELLKYGVRIYTYENGFLHAKTMVVDGVVSSVGTANFDVRSFKLNFEVNAIVYDTVVGKKLCDAFEEDLKLSLELTHELYLQRGIRIRLKESISRLLSPLL